MQNAGAVAAGTGLAKSAIIQKISLAQADAVKTVANASGQVTVTVVPSNPIVNNPNGQSSTSLFRSTCEVKYPELRMIQALPTSEVKLCTWLKALGPETRQK